MTLIHPKAFLGYAPHPSGGFRIRVCAWCPDAGDMQKIADETELEVTHGICDGCKLVQLALAGIAL